MEKFLNRNMIPIIYWYDFFRIPFLFLLARLIINISLHVSNRPTYYSHKYLGFITLEMVFMGICLFGFFCLVSMGSLKLLKDYFVKSNENVGGFKSVCNIVFLHLCGSVIFYDF